MTLGERFRNKPILGIIKTNTLFLEPPFVLRLFLNKENTWQFCEFLNFTVVSLILKLGFFLACSDFLSILSLDVLKNVFLIKKIVYSRFIKNHETHV